MPGRLEFDMKFSTTGKDKKRRSQDSPMQILFVGNFSGNCSNVKNSPGERIQKLDPDNFDRLLASIGPRLELAMDDNQTGGMAIEFNTLEDFHPDRLFDRLPVFQQLKTLRADLGNPTTFAKAVAQLAVDTEAAKPVESTVSTSTEGEAGLLDQLLGGRSANIAPDPSTVVSQKHVDINTFIKNSIAPYIETGVHPQQEQYLKSVDQTISALMRKILHHPEFQALEAAWRGVHECLSRLEWEETLNIFLFNISKDQLREDFEKSSDDISASLLYRLAVEQSVQVLGGEPWSMLIGLYSFTNQDDDVVLLSRFGQVAYHSGGPFIAEAHPSLLGCESLVNQPDAGQWQPRAEQDMKIWNELRDQPYAPWLALAFPRFLLRLPYGGKSDEIERFEFEEIPEDLAEDKRHTYYLWGNAAIVCALLIAQSYQQNGWSMSLGDVLELDDLPLHVYETNGEKVVKPCGEVIMSERGAETIERYGVMAIMSYKNRNAVRLWRFRSLGGKTPGLAGPWEG